MIRISPLPSPSNIAIFIDFNPIERLYKKIIENMGDIFDPNAKIFYKLALSSFSSFSSKSQYLNTKKIQKYRKYGRDI